MNTKTTITSLMLSAILLLSMTLGTGIPVFAAENLAPSAEAIAGGGINGNGIVSGGGTQYLNDTIYSNAAYQDGTSGEYFGLKFQSPTKLNKLVFYIRSGSGASRITQAKLQISDNGTEWTDIPRHTPLNSTSQSTVGEFTGYVTVFTFSELTTQYIRLYVIKGANPQVTEIEAYYDENMTTDGIMLGDYYSIGSYKGEDILWRVSDIDEENGPLLLSDKILQKMVFDAEGEATGSHVSASERQTDGSNFWADSNLRAWLNSSEESITQWPCGNAPDYGIDGGFLCSENFTDVELNLMTPVTQRTIVSKFDTDFKGDSQSTAVSGFAPFQWKTSVSEAKSNYDTSIYHHFTTDKVFVLDVKQLSKVYNNSSALGEDYWIGKYIDSDSYGFSWLRTPNAENGKSVRIVNANSKNVGDTSANTPNICGVRPAFYLNEEAVRIVSGSGTESDPFVVDKKSDILDSADIINKMEKDIPMGSTSLNIPKLFDNDTASIVYSSNPNVIGLDASIAAPEYDTEVELAFQITRGDNTMITDKLNFTVHRIIPLEEAAQNFNTSTVKAYIDSKKLRVPELPEGFEFLLTESSNENVINTKGEITPPSSDTNVELSFMLTRTFDNSTLNLTTQITVPKSTTDSDIEFFKDLKYGLFVHYVFAGDGRGLTVFNDGTKAANIDEFSSKVNAKQFAADCESFGVQYVIFTAWHARTNPLYPSEVHKKYRENKTDVPDVDILMPIVDELNKKNIKVIFYTHPNDCHDFSEEDKISFDYYDDGLNTGSVKHVDYEKWNNYINELYAELCTRYKGKFCGLWIDEGAVISRNDAVVDYERLRDTIKGIDPSIVMIANNQKGDRYTCDTVMQENPFPVYSADISSWRGFDSHSVTSVVGNGSWMALNPNTVQNSLGKPEDMYRYMIYKSSLNAQGGGYALAAGPYIGLDEWEMGVKELLTKVGDYVSPIKDTVFNTRASTSYITTAQKFGDLQWGVALQSKDGSKEFIHVLKPPAGDTLELPAPADNKKFISARLVNSQGNVILNQTEDGVSLQLSDGAKWDLYNTVIELTCQSTFSANVSFDKSAAEDKINIQADINMKSETLQTATCYMVLKNNGKIQKIVKSEPYTLNNNEKNITLNIITDSFDNNSIVDVFIWDDDMKPLCEVNSFIQ